ncbi:MAG TPA: NTP transferase domain-containing protein [Nitrosopumilaceae archaeon]|nr:NTP transferase domain-containing protein [Nitrosopumilaceae archaeon]
MAGGKGTRMKLEHEKLLLKYKKPIILHVIEALKESGCFSKIIAVTSPNSPKTKQLIEQSDVEIIDTPGTDYVNDLNLVLRSLNDYVLVSSGDLPFLDSEIIKNIVEMHKLENVWTSIVVTKGFLDSLHLTSDFKASYEGQDCFLTGISIINANKIKNLKHVKETFQILDDKRIAFNLNTKQDYELLGVS